MKRNQGFTLVELVIVIVILGILAVTAAPKFFNFATDARVSTLNAVKSSINSAGSMVYGKAVLEGKQAAATATLDSPAIALVYGYPKATSTDLVKAIDLETSEWDLVEVAADPNANPATGASVTIKPKGVTTVCQVTYTEAKSASEKPVVTVTSTGC